MTTTEHAHDRDDHSDPTLYRTPADAVAAPPEKLAYVVGVPDPSVSFEWRRPATRLSAFSISQVLLMTQTSPAWVWLSWASSDLGQK